MSSSTSLLVSCALCAVLFAVACGKKSESSGGGSASASSASPPTAPVAAADPATRAREMFKTQCAVCHGESGKGDGVGAAALDPKPRNYSDKEWQAKTDDARIKKVILEGGPANGLNAAMPPYAAQLDDPAVVDELVKIIRAFGA